MHSHIFLDESGNLGWKFNAPYRNGGSSRFLTIGHLLTPITDVHVPKRIVREVYNKYSFNPKQEIKASDLKSHHKQFICEQTVKMMNKYGQFHLGTITVRKENVANYIKNDGNKLYNYMMGLSLIEKIEDDERSKISRDNRSVKVLSGQSCIDYLQTIIWFHKNKAAILTDNPTHSHTDDGIIFIDWIKSLNVIDVVFHDDERVRQLFHKFLDYTTPPKDQILEYVDIYYEMLYEMTKCSGYTQLLEEDIRKNYAPLALEQHYPNRYAGIRRTDASYDSESPSNHRKDEYED